MTDTTRPSPLRQDATRGRLLALLREGKWTVDDLARRLRLTDNAVRFHLATLESAGTVRKEGVRRRQGAGKPADLYALTPDAEESFSRAYAPVLIACVAELRETMSTAQLVAFLRRVGKRLADGLRNPRGSLPNRVAAAAELLSALGGVTTVEKSGNTFHIIGRACPLSRAVEADHCVCAAVTALVAEMVWTQTSPSAVIAPGVRDATSRFRAEASHQVVSRGDSRAGGRYLTVMLPDIAAAPWTTQ